MSKDQPDASFDTETPQATTDEHADVGAETPGRLDKVGAQALELSRKLLNVGVDGRGPWKGSIEVAEEHLATYGNPDVAIQRLIATHVRLTTATGFVSGLGGLLTLPVAIPADFTALWLSQARLAGAIAHLRGYSVHSEEVRSVILLSLIGSSATEALSKAGVAVGTKSAVSLIGKVPGRVLIEINKRVGFRLITKAGTKGIVNLTRLAPIAGGVVGGGINFASTRAVGGFAKGNFPAVDRAMPGPTDDVVEGEFLPADRSA